MFEVESYLRHQGSTFVSRFDANCYLTITRAMDYFDLAAEHGGDLAGAFAGTRTRFCVISFSSDWLFPTAQSRADRARAERGGGQCQLRRDRRPTRATTPSCSTSRISTARWPASLAAAPSTPACRHERAPDERTESRRCGRRRGTCGSTCR